MDLFSVKTVAHYNTKLLKRSWLFRLFVLFSLLFIIIYQLLTQSNLILGFVSGRHFLTSFLPFVNVYFYNLFMAFPVIFLAGGFINKERKLDTMDIIYVRPVSNVQYLGGVSWGIIRPFLSIGLIVLLIGMMINLFASPAPFCLGHYLFYYVTLLIPTLIFVLGFSFLVLTLIPNRALNILIMLGYIGITIFYVGDAVYGLFDLFGTSLPNVFSDLTGHSGMAAYLLQRMCCLLLGLGFISFTIAMFKRLPNHPGNPAKQLLMAALFTLAGLVCGVVAYTILDRDFSGRATYAETYNNYEAKEKLTLLSQNITYAPHGGGMHVRTRMELSNANDLPVTEGLLYLNPALDVLKISQNGTDIPYKRDQQVVLLQKTFQAGEVAVIDVEYRGGIDPGICYLDVPDELIKDVRSSAYSSLRFGKKYAFLGKNYTLLIPEVLWYPVACPPVNPQASSNIRKNFTQFELTVTGTAGKMVISQGERTETENGIRFREDHPLDGITLCIGNYTRYALSADSVSYELYLSKNHGDIIESLELVGDTLPQLLTNFRYEQEAFYGKAFPFNRIMLVESPISFSSYYRNEHGGSELVQPEIIFLPERGYGLLNQDFENQKEMRKESYQLNEEGAMVPLAELNIEMGIVRSFLRTSFLTEYGRRQMASTSFFSTLFRGASIFHDFYRLNNERELSSLFFGRVTSIVSDDYPVMDAVMNIIRKTGTEEKAKSNNWELDASRQKAIDYLNGRSFQQAVYDPEIEPHVLYQVFKLKSEMLCGYFSTQGIKTAELNDFLNDFINRYNFNQIRFEDLKQEFSDQFGVGWDEILPLWYTSDEIPAFLIQDILIEKIEEDISNTDNGITDTRNRIQFAVYNDSDVDGIISLSMSSSEYSHRGDIFFTFGESASVSASFADRNFLIKAREGKKIAVVLDGHPSSFCINANIAQNRPNNIRSLEPVKGKTKDTTQYEQSVDKRYFMPEPNEIIVDNEDPEFQMENASTGGRLMQWSGEVRKEDKYLANTYVLSNKKWNFLIDNGYYGGCIRSCVAKKAAKGDARVIWNAELNRGGEYEVYVYMPQLSSSSSTSFRFGGLGMTTSFSMDQSGKKEQYYTIDFGDRSEEIVLDVRDQSGWVSLGRFTFSPGNASVSLSDKGEPQQVIYGDAVRWIYLEE